MARGPHAARSKRGDATDLVMLAVVNLHGRGIYAGLKGSVIVREFGQRVSHVSCSDLIDGSRERFRAASARASKSSLMRRWKV